MTKSKSRRRFIFMSLVLIIGICLSVLRFDIPFTNTTYNGFINSIPLGFDLQGGVSVVFEASLPEDNLDGDLDISINGTISRIELLLEDKGYSEHNVYKQGATQIVAEVAGLTNTDDLFEQLEQPSSFKITAAEEADAEARLDGNDILNAGYSAQNGSDGKIDHGVAIIFTEEGADKFETFTEALAEEDAEMYIYVGEDQEPLTKLTVSDKITTGSMFISSETMTEEQATEMALKVLAGAFDTRLDLVQNNVVSSSLGADVLTHGVIAIFAALLVSVGVMILMYRHFGLVSSFTTMFWAVAVIFVLQSFPLVRLSLSSFAGLLLSLIISNISYAIMYEKIKEENAKGKKLHMSVKAGLKKSVGTIVDYHVVTLIVAFILMLTGSGSATGFALSVLIGVSLSLAASLLLFKWLINSYLPLNSKNVTKFNFEKVEVKFNENK